MNPTDRTTFLNMRQLVFVVLYENQLRIRVTNARLAAGVAQYVLSPFSLANFVRLSYEMLSVARAG